MRTGQPNTRASCGIQAPLSHASRLDPHAAFPDTRSRSLNKQSVSKNVPDRNPLTSDCAYMLTPDMWDCRPCGRRARFTSIFLASSFSCSQTESTPAPAQVTQAVGHLRLEIFSRDVLEC